MVNRIRHYFQQYIKVTTFQGHPPEDYLLSTVSLSSGRSPPVSNKESVESSRVVLEIRPESCACRTLGVKEQPKVSLVTTNLRLVDFGSFWSVHWYSADREDHRTDDDWCILFGTVLDQLLLNPKLLRVYKGSFLMV